MSRSQSSIRFLPKYRLRAFCAAKILAIPATLIFLRSVTHQAWSILASLSQPYVGLRSTGRSRSCCHLWCRPDLLGHLQSEIESGSVIGL
jgi:hypothetical protein